MKTKYHKFNNLALVEEQLKKQSLPQIVLLHGNKT